MQDNLFQKLISESEAGDEDAKSQLWELVYTEMKKLAHYRLAGSNPVSLSPTMLVHEVYLKLDTPAHLEVADKAHFMAVVCRAMRFVLADYVRKKGAAKRGVYLEADTLHEEVEPQGHDPLELLVLNEAIEKLGRLDSRLAHVIECRYFGGLTNGETAQALGLSLRGVERLWARAKLYLFKILQTGTQQTHGDKDS